jgi:transposase-like protein
MFNKINCPRCQSEDYKLIKIYSTSNNGDRKLYECNDCHEQFSETKGTFMENIKKPISLISSVLKARTEGIGFNAACRVFNIAKNTLHNWEQKFAKYKDTLMLYSIVHTFLSQLIVEGDELYTKVNKNMSVEECEGWTIMLMDRASRFIFALECGKKDSTLFLHAIHILMDVIKNAQDVGLVTDGERRYSNTLFEICNEIFRSGKPGRPPKVLCEGVKARIKNKGSQNKKRGRKRPKYETPHREHPNTVQNISENDIHTNHAEAFNASLRRKSSAYRRKTNTYAKSKPNLQRVLDVYWVVHNFIREHFTTKQVPAVSLGIIESGFSWSEILMLRSAI